MKHVKRITVHYLDGSRDIFDEKDNPDGWYDKYMVKRPDWVAYQYLEGNTNILQIDTHRTITQIPMHLIKKVYIDEKE